MGVWGMPSFVRHPSCVVVKPDTRVYVKNQAESRKKMKRPTTAVPIQDPWSLWIIPNIIDTELMLSLFFLGISSEGSVWESNPQTHMGGRQKSSARTAHSGVPPSRVARRRPGRRRCRFPLSAACTRSALRRSLETFYSKKRL